MKYLLMTVTSIMLFVSGSLLTGCDNHAAPVASDSATKPVEPTKPPESTKVAEAQTWERRVQNDELQGIEEDWYQIEALPTDESDSVSGPLGSLTKYPRIAVLCEKHQLKQIQFEPRLRYGLDFRGYTGNAIPARLDDKTMHTFYWSLADSGDTYMFNKADLRLLLKHKQAIFGVNSRGHQVALNFTEIPQPDAQMKADCSL